MTTNFLMDFVATIINKTIYIFKYKFHLRLLLLLLLLLLTQKNNYHY